MAADPPAELRSERLVLRRRRDADREPFAALDADPVVTEHLVSTLTRAQSTRSSTAPTRGSRSTGDAASRHDARPGRRPPVDGRLCLCPCVVNYRTTDDGRALVGITR